MHQQCGAGPHVAHDEDDLRAPNTDGAQSLADHSKAQLPKLCRHWLHVELDDTMLRLIPSPENPERWLAPPPKARECQRRFPLISCVWLTVSLVFHSAI